MRRLTIDLTDEMLAKLNAIAESHKCIARSGPRAGSPSWRAMLKEIADGRLIIIRHPSLSEAALEMAAKYIEDKEIRSIDLARTVMEREHAREKIRLAANALKHHHMSRPGIAAIVQLLSENETSPSVDATE